METQGCQLCSWGYSKCYQICKMVPEEPSRAYDTHKLLLVLGEPASFHYLIRNV